MKKPSVFRCRAAALALCVLFSAAVLCGCMSAGGDLPESQRAPASQPSEELPDAVLQPPVLNAQFAGGIIPNGQLPFSVESLSLLYAVCPGEDGGCTLPAAAGSLLTDALCPQGWLRLQDADAAAVGDSVLLGAKNPQGAQLFWCGGAQVYLRGDYSGTLQCWAVTPTEAQALQLLHEQLAAAATGDALQQPFCALVTERGDFGEPLGAAAVTPQQSEALWALLQSAPWQPLSAAAVSSSLREAGGTLYTAGGYALDVCIGGSAGIIQLTETLRDGSPAYYALELSLWPQLSGLLNVIRFAPAQGLAYAGYAEAGGDTASFWEGSVLEKQALSAEQQAQLCALLQPERWVQTENALTPGQWYDGGTVFVNEGRGRLVLRGDAALYLSPNSWQQPLAWRLPQGTAAAAAAFLAAAANSPAAGAALFPAQLTDFTVIGIDTLGPASFDTRFELTGALQQQFFDALHPESWQRYEPYIEAGWTVSCLTAAAPDGSCLSIYPQGAVAFLVQDGRTAHFRLPPLDADAALALENALSEQAVQAAPSLPYALAPVRAGGFAGQTVCGAAYSRAAGGELFNWLENGGGWYADADGGLVLTWRSGAHSAQSPLCLSPENAEQAAGLGVFVSETVSALCLPAADGVQIAVTADCGASWQTAVLETSAAKLFIGFTSAQHGWLVAEDTPAAGGAAHRLFFTSDGGVSWREQPLTAPAALCGQLSGAGFVDENTGFLCERYGSGLTVHATDDGGSTWRTLALEGDARTEAWSPVKDSNGTILLPLGQRQEDGSWRLRFAVSFGSLDGWCYVTNP
ncbi:MAG: hypothetical protein IJ412_05595 [Oscillospiraceae bacterium]|nr:hypothetical protein [Oscillospiraceae bacterium]